MKFTILNTNNGSAMEMSFESKEQLENQGKDWSWANFNSIVRSRLKGKMSSSTIRRSSSSIRL